MKDAILTMMLDEKVGENPLCINCRSRTNGLTHALTPWVVHKKGLSPQSILFVGKVARGDQLGEMISESLENVIPFGSDFIKKSAWPYWSYTRSIIESVYGDIETGLQHISFSNMVKCNNKSTPDTSSHESKDHCIRKNRFIWKEIETLKPRLIIFYTNTDYDEFIEEFMPSYSAECKNHTTRTHRVEVGAKTMPWWERSFHNVQNEEVLRFLRVGHPERKNKADYTRSISEWIQMNI